MSRDGYMTIDTGGPEPAEVADIGNYTHNVGRMWHRAVAAVSDLPDLDATGDMTGAEAGPILAAAARYMDEHPDEFTPLNPPNGWGSYGGARAYLWRAATACAEHPKATLRWSV
jgi:hypothetical protein